MVALFLISIKGGNNPNAVHEYILVYADNGVLFSYKKMMYGHATTSMNLANIMLSQTSQT